VSKRLASSYSSGPPRDWRKTKCEGWMRDNTERFRMFEGKKKPEQEQKVLIRKRQELARVQERLRDPDARPGIRKGAAPAYRHPGSGNR
jgi:hypothetical protein